MRMCLERIFMREASVSIDACVSDYPICGRGRRHNFGTRVELWRLSYIKKSS